MLAIQNNRDLERTQSFTYDELNRVKTAEVPTAWGLSFGYDIWANLLSQTVTKGSAPMLSVTATTKNRIAGFCYDAAGNLLGETNCSAYAYDAENRMSASAAGGLYFYDGDGKRVKKSSGKLYWTGVGSDALSETDLLVNILDEYVYFGGKRITRRKSTGEVNYYFSDHLGTSRVVTNATGTVLDDADFYPFGGERPILSSSGNSYKFTGKERDLETGLDYFGARYYGSSLGRFTSADPSRTGIHPRDPQTWNLYSYVTNNPLKFNDPTGEARNPVTNQEGINPVPARGQAGRIRTDKNPHTGEYGIVRNKVGNRFTTPHRGTDINAASGAALHATQNGNVVAVKGDPNDKRPNSFGLQVIIKTETGHEVTMSHLSASGVKQGQEVQAGQVIAASGNSGNASVYENTPDQQHVDVMVKDPSGNPMDPARYLNDPTTRTEPLTPGPNESQPNTCSKDSTCEHEKPPPK